MAQYEIYFTQTASTTVKVEADSFDEAVDAAYAEGHPSLCAQCSGWGRESGIDLSGDWEADERTYTVDGEYVTVPEEPPFKPSLVGEVEV